MTRLRAQRISGEGKASAILAVQLPLIAKTFPVIQDCHPGTINLRLEAPLVVATPDHRTPPLYWRENLIDGEVFDLLHVDLEILPQRTSHGAWLYIPHRSPHRKNLPRHEVIAPLLNLDGVDEFCVTIRRACIHVPYRFVPLYVVV